MSDAVTASVSRLAAALRAEGVRIGIGELLVALRALDAVDPCDPRQARAALRAALCSRHADLAAFDRAYAACFGAAAAAADDHDLLDPAGPGEGAHAQATVAVGDERPPAALDLELDPDILPAAWSAVELLGEKDFADYTEADRAAARSLMARIARRGPARRSRRTKPTRRRGEIHDLRATLRASMRHGGEPIDRRFRAPAQRRRPLVLVCDVSGSMEPYARMLLQYLQASVAARQRVEAFVFGTRLTRVTRELGGRDPDRALARATVAAQDWSGGTRIGDALATLNREHGRRIGRGAVVVVLSDGWDRGDPEVLADEMARLRRCAHQLVWLNPLKAHAGYEPLTRGMAAALPHLDHFMAGNSIASLEDLADLMDATTMLSGRR